MASKKLSINLLSQNSAGAKHILNVTCKLKNEKRNSDINLDFDTFFV
jgi:hypothetical protein